MAVSQLAYRIKSLDGDTSCSSMTQLWSAENGIIREDKTAIFLEEIPSCFINSTKALFGPAFEFNALRSIIGDIDSDVLIEEPELSDSEDSIAPRWDIFATMSPGETTFNQNVHSDNQIIRHQGSITQHFKAEFKRAHTSIRAKIKTKLDTYEDQRDFDQDF